DARVLAHCHWQPRRWEHPVLIALHGLNGSSAAHYMCGLAAKAFARGMNIVRLNQRNCGNTEHLSSGLFHSGLTADAAHVIDELMRVDGLAVIGVAGYSDRKSTRLNSSHLVISYAVFCLKKKKH